MTDWQAIAAEIERFATIPARGPEDVLLKDVYKDSDIGRTRAERIFRGLEEREILRKYRMVMTEGHSKVMAYRLVEGKTLDDLGEAVKELA